MKTRNYKFFSALMVAVVTLCFIQSCEKDAVPAPPPPPVIPTSFTEEFDTVANLARKGWIIQNNSEPGGASCWRQGLYEHGSKLSYLTEYVGFPAFSAKYSPNDFISCDLSAGGTGGPATISAWLISPATRMKNGDRLIFYTRCYGNYADRVQVRANFTTASANVGNTSTSVGDFTTLLLDINPDLSVTGYPNFWTRYTITLSNLPSALVSGRFAFRYFVTNGGPAGANSEMVGIDQLHFVSQ